MNEFEKYQYLNNLKKLSNYISTYVNAFEKGRYVLVDNDKDDNLIKGKFTIKHLNEMILTETVSVLDKYSRNILRDFYGQVRHKKSVCPFNYFRRVQKGKINYD